MKIVKVSYSALANLGDYQNERVGMVAILDEGDSPEDVVLALKEKVTPLCDMRLGVYREEAYRLRASIEELRTKLAKYQDQWNQAAEFLRAQGIKPDAPNFPQFTNLLPSSNLQEEIATSEFIEDSDDDPDDIPL